MLCCATWVVGIVCGKDCVYEVLGFSCMRKEEVMMLQQAAPGLLFMSLRLYYRTKQSSRHPNDIIASTSLPASAAAARRPRPATTPI